MTAISAVFYRETKIRATNMIYIFWDMIYPLCYLLVFGVGINAAVGSPAALKGADYNSFFLAGVLALASFGIAANASWSFFLDRDNGIFFEMLTYPMSRAEYLLGKVLFCVLIGLAQTLLTVTLGAALLHIHIRNDRLPLLFAGMLVGTAGWFFFYSILAFRIRRNDLFNSVTSVFYFVFLFASPLFYPLEPLPRWFRAVARANPITWQADLLRYGSIGSGAPGQMAVESGAFCLFVLACFFYAARCLQQE